MKGLVCAALAAITLVGCGDDTGAAPEREVGNPPPTPPARPSGADTKRSLPFESAKELCEVIGVRGMADEYGGEPAVPITVAEAYAEDSIQPWARRDAIDGCLAGFEK